jgi:multidrug efflux system outer membrane protein
MRARRIVAGLLLVVFGTSCAIGPDYERPDVAPPQEYRGEVTPDEATSIADLPWWEIFEDPVLQDLIREALAANYDLRSAIQRVEQARNIVTVAQSPFYPQFEYQAQAGRQRDPKLHDRPHDTYSLFFGAFALAWELDVWGRIRRSSEAARYALMATEEFRRGVLLGLVTGVAQSYLSLIELDRELEIARETAESFRQTLELFERRFEGGIGDKLQVARAEAALALTEAQIPELERQIVVQENAISVLLGRNPGPIDRGRPLDDYLSPPAIPAGIPSDLLERRPDVLQAENTVASANAQVGVAMANFFPRIGLTALYGGQSTELTDILKDNFSIWNIAGNLTGPLFQGFELLGRYRAQVAGFEETVAQYEKAVITAFAEVSDALTAQSKLARSRTAQERAVAAYKESVRLSRVRYDSGLASYFEVIEAQQQLFPAQLTLAQIRRNELITVVTLYRALGGGWQLTDEEWEKGAYAVPAAAQSSTTESPATEPSEVETTNPDAEVFPSPQPQPQPQPQTTP